MPELNSYGNDTAQKNKNKLLFWDDIALDDGEFEVLLIQKPTNLVELHGIITALLKEKKAISILLFGVTVKPPPPVCSFLLDRGGRFHSNT